MCYIHCLLSQKVKGGKKAEAKAKVVAAVDLARVRKPMHGEKGHAEEETYESDLKQQSMLSTTEQQVTVKTEAATVPMVQIPIIPPPSIQTTADEQSIHVTQVCYLFKYKKMLHFL